jgi:hypothetical protein
MTQQWQHQGSAALEAGTQGREANRYGAFQNVAAQAMESRRRGLAQASRDRGMLTSQATSAGANPFGAARLAQRGYLDRVGQVRTQEAQTLADVASMEAQRREQEALRRQQEARQFLGAGLSTAGAVLGSVVAPGLGGGIGGGLGSAVGGAMGLGSAQPQPMQPQGMPMPTNASGPAMPRAAVDAPQVYDPRREHYYGPSGRMVR